ncbi:MAG: CHAD domain-containing protein, partial [Methylobacteriaceae bacterium]|nr:CHAD domain-containing protein [Methylobacteriaceae bacterium]
RTIWRLAGPDREVEIAVDLGTVTARDRTEPIAEIELELKVGSPDRLFELARLLDRSSPLAIAVETKSARGYALLAPKVATKAAPVVLRRGMTTAVAFQTVARSCLRQFRLNEPLVRARSPEGLHQARVALRRLRSALSVFGPALADRRLPAIKSALRRVSGQLGEARNLDVYLAKTLGPASTRSPEDADLAAFLAEVRAEREAVYERIQATLRSRRFRIFLLDCLAWIEAGPWLTAADAKLAAARDRPVEDFAMDSLRRRRRKLKRAGRALALLGAPARHQVRIDAKKLRYASEFFGALAEGGKEKRRYVAFTEALAALQEELGALNDAATGDDLTRELLTRLGREPDFAARFAPPALQPDPSGQAVEPGGEEARHLARAVAAHAAFVEAKRFLR